MGINDTINFFAKEQEKRIREDERKKTLESINNLGYKTNEKNKNLASTILILKKDLNIFVKENKILQEKNESLLNGIEEDELKIIKLTEENKKLKSELSNRSNFRDVMENTNPKEVKKSEEKIKRLENMIEELKSERVFLKNKFKTEKKALSERLTLMETVLKHKTEALKKSKSEPTNENIVGWKGKSDLKIRIIDDKEYNVSYHLKSKSTAKVYKTQYIVSKSNVNKLLSVIKKLTNNGKNETKYREIAKELIAVYGLNVGIDAFNGGHNRKKYFIVYQYPMKILEYYKIVDYSGRGKVNLLKKDITRI